MRLLSGVVLLALLLSGCGIPSAPTTMVEGADTFDSATGLISLHFDHAPDRDDGHSAATDRTLLEVLYGARWVRRHVVAVSKKRIHVVQHSGINEWFTWLRALRYTRNETDYRRVGDANAYLNVAGGDDAFESAATSHAIFGPVWTTSFEYYDPQSRLDFSDTGALLHLQSRYNPRT
jgi:hypothetical protein